MCTCSCSMLLLQPCCTASPSLRGSTAFLLQGSQSPCQRCCPGDEATYRSCHASWWHRREPWGGKAVGISVGIPLNIWDINIINKNGIKRDCCSRIAAHFHLRFSLTDTWMCSVSHFLSPKASLVSVSFFLSLTISYPYFLHFSPKAFVYVVILWGAGPGLSALPVMSLQASPKPDSGATYAARYVCVCVFPFLPLLNREDREIIIVLQRLMFVGFKMCLLLFKSIVCS